MATRRKPKQRTNVQCVTDLMEFSQHGALAQLFVVDALMKHAALVAAAEPAALDTGFISGAAWRNVAREILGKLKAHLGEEA